MAVHSMTAVCPSDRPPFLYYVSVDILCLLIRRRVSTYQCKRLTAMTRSSLLLQYPAADRAWSSMLGARAGHSDQLRAVG